jgi:exodeoxyribonuclease-3
MAPPGLREFREQFCVKIATYNINNVVRRLPNLLAWLDTARPDLVCLQELKTVHNRFPREELEAAGYHAAWRGERQWNGVAILGRDTPPIVTNDALPGDAEDQQSRYIEAAYQGVLVASLYLPNGNPQPGPKFEYKLAWFERLIEHAATLQEAGLPVILAGDYNVVPTDDDIYSAKSLAGNALIQPESRAAFARLLAGGWTDAVRTRHPEAPMYSFWDYQRQRWEKDRGMRLDHLLLSRSVAPRLLDAGVDRSTRGEEGASDHAPVWITLT